MCLAMIADGISSGECPNCSPREHPKRRSGAATTACGRGLYAVSRLLHSKLATGGSETPRGLRWPYGSLSETRRSCKHDLRERRKIGMLNEKEKETLRTLTVEVLLEVRGAYLRTPGANILKHWDQLNDRVRMAARTSASPAEWMTALTRSLKIGAPSSASSAATMALTHEVHDRHCESAWLDLVESELGLLMAMTRVITEERRRTTGEV
jgi:hypothetical protein